LLFIGDDWAEGHHDVVVQDDAAKTLARRRLPEGVDGLARFHELIASCWGEDSEPDPAQVVVVIETDRGAWVKALAAAGYRVYPVNPKQAARHKETIAVSGKKDDFFDAGCLADMGRTRRHQMRELAADSDIAEPSRSPPARTRSWCGSAPGSCCGCGRRCGSTSPPRWRPTRPCPWPGRTPWSCSAGHRTRRRRRG